jgi:hypothetical protein
MAGGLGAASVVFAGSASACGVGSPCTVDGSASIVAGSLTLTTPTTLNWSTILSGVDQYLVDTTGAHTSYKVNDATGSGNGWNVTAAATTFTDGTSDTLGDTGTLSTNGSLSSATSTSGPSAICDTSTGANTCTLPTNGTTYPVAITTDPSTPTAYTIFDTAASSGLGALVVGTGVHPVGWWVKVPANTLAGTYTSTLTVSINSGP